MDVSDLAQGVVIENHGAIFDVDVDGRMVRCFLRGRLKKDKRTKVGLIAAGDRVKVRLLEYGRGVVEEVLPRESDVSRAAAGSIPLEQTLAANVDQAVIVFAAAEPAADLFMLDRFLVMMLAARLNRIICINKCDLAEAQMLRARFAVYEGIGHRVLFTSAIRGDGLAALRDAMKDRRSVICGPSGVGKSSLLNAIAPGVALRIGEVGAVTHKGRHTTSSVALVPLPFGGWVADTPGLRQAGFWQVSIGHVIEAFTDLHPYLGRCEFSNCTHRRQKGCALEAAARAGRIDPRRLRSFLEMGGR